jgi:hypothetical protein
VRRARLAVLALALAGCGGSEETVTTVTVVTTLREPTTVQVTTTVAATTTVREALRGPGADPDDVEGPLDVERLAATRAGDLLHVTLTTYETWPATALAGPAPGRAGEDRVTLAFDTDLDGAREYRGRLLYDDDVGLALWIRGQGQAFEPVPAARGSESRVELTFPVDVMFLDAESEVDIQVAAVTLFDGVRDRAPDAGWLLVPYF